MAGKIIQGFEVPKGFKEEVDVVIVGSGAGGAVAAAELAEGGLSVVVLEEGGYYTSKDFNQDPLSSITRMYRDAGSNVIMGNPNIVWSEGRCVGGSTVINGGMCWRTPDKVLKRWQWECGLKDMTLEHMGPFFDKVEERVNVAPQHPDTISVGERKFFDAANKLGYFVKPDRRNQKNCCGSNICIFGCPDNRKQSMIVSYLPRAVAADAKVYSDCRVTKVITKNGRAVGLSGKVIDRETSKKVAKFEVRAKIVILAAGALQTPVLLMKNRLSNSSKQVGKNFICHPNVKAVGIFDEPVYYWKGVHQGHQCHEFIDEGIVITISGVHPALLAMSFPQYGKKHFALMEKFNHMIPAGCLVDDTTTGSVRPGPGGVALMSYQVDNELVKRFVRGVALTSEILFTAGANTVVLPFHGWEPLRSIDEIGRLYENPPEAWSIELFTVHAMGTTRMGSDPKRFVVGPWGESFDVKNMFIVDGGIIPTSLGVNPQETIMALATRSCGYILDNKSRYLTV